MCLCTQGDGGVHIAGLSASLLAACVLSADDKGTGSPPVALWHSRRDQVGSPLWPAFAPGPSGLTPNVGAKTDGQRHFVPHALWPHV